MRKELLLVLGDEKKTYISILIYTVFIGLAGVSIPVSIQALVNIIPSTMMYYPLFLLSGVLLILLTLSMIVYGLQKFVTEIFKRRIFVRITSLMMTRALYFDKKTMQSSDTEQIFDRFFEIPNIQTSTTEILIGAFTAFVQVITAVIICSFYHPSLLIFNLIIVSVVYFILRSHGASAVKTIIKESTAKYETASWVAEVGRKYFYLKSHKARDYASKKTNTLIANYISQRKKHFHHLFTQIIYLLIVYAIGNVTLLILCGVLILGEKLTIGQFVATEVFFSYVFTHVLRGGNYLESFYKLVASCNKISLFYNIPLEDYSNHNDDFSMTNIHIHSLTMPHIPSKVSLHIDLNGSYHTFMNFHEKTKSFLMTLLMGWDDQYYNNIRIDTMPFSEINMDKYRDKVAFIDSSNIICTKIKEFATSSCPMVSQTKFDSIIKLVDLYDAIQALPQKEHTKIISSKYPLNKEEVIKLKIAKALLEEVKLIIIDYPIADNIIYDNKPLLDYIIGDPSITLVHFTNNQKAVPLAQYVYRYDPQSQSIVKHNV